MAEPESGSLKHVQKWLKEHGTVLEMTTAATLRRDLADDAAGIKATAVHSQPYEHVDTDKGETKLREIDVVATATRTVGRTKLCLQIVTECKSSKSSPWVFYRGGDATAVPVDIGGLSAWESQGTSGGEPGRVENIVARKGAFFLRAENASYALASASNNDKNEALDAVRQVLSGTNGVQEQIAAHARESTVSIFIPLVVTSAPLFTVTLLDGGPLIEPTDRQMVHGRFDRGESIRAVWVVHEDVLGEFAVEARQFLRSLDYRQ